jgi:hypothetical protein
MNNITITWHTTPESVHTAYWRPVLEAEGFSPDDIASSTIHAETVDGETVELEEGAVLDAMRAQKCWGFFDGEHRVIHAWAAADADPATVIRMLAHEIGHGTGEQSEGDIEEEARAEAFGVVAEQAFDFWQRRAQVPAAGDSPDSQKSSPEQPEPTAQWDDPRVQAVYQVLCSDEAPPPEQHWEGFLARRIVDALAAQQPAEPTDEQILTLAYKHRCTGIGSRARDVLPLVREVLALTRSAAAETPAYQPHGQVPTQQPAPAVAHALGEAVAALYFDDSSYYASALWTIVLDLGGREAVDALQADSSSAYHRYGADRNATSTAGATGESNA